MEWVDAVGWRWWRWAWRVLLVVMAVAATASRPGVPRHATQAPHKEASAPRPAPSGVAAVAASELR